MAESINLIKLVSGGAALTTNQVADDPEVRCPPGYVQRIKSFYWGLNAIDSKAMTPGGANIECEVKVGSRTLLHADNYLSNWTGDDGTNVNMMNPASIAKGLVPIDDIFYPGEQLSIALDTPTGEDSTFALLMERISLEELSAEARRR